MENMNAHRRRFSEGRKVFAFSLLTDIPIRMPQETQTGNCLENCRCIVGIVGSASALPPF